MKDKKSTKSHKRAIKLTLLSCAWRCSSKLQVIQSWEILFQKPSKVHKYQYTQTHIVFVFFWFFIFLFYEKQPKKKKKLKNNQTKT